MEDIFQILIFVAFAVLSFVPQLRKGKTSAPDSRPFSPEEEAEEYAEWEAVEQEETLSQPIVRREVKPRKEKPRKKEMKSAAPSPKTQEADTKKIRLSSREEARRAFIYSEIFNRKYS